MTETVDGGPVLLSEEYVQDCFHSYLKSALTQAKAERLLDPEVLSSAEGDLMITGPALCLYFAALRSTTSPPSVPLPRLSKSTAPPNDLSNINCPPAFRPFLTVWSHTVPHIQALIPQDQHDLARVICGLPAICDPPNPHLAAIAADLRAVAIEISMRRSFQDRYASDLQAALDAGRRPSRRLKANFVPPPVYEPTSPSSATSTLPSTPSTLTVPLSPLTPTSGSSRSPSPSSPRAPSPSILGPDAPAIEFIRETLYAALADVLEQQPAIRRMLKRDPIRAYFASVALAILEVSINSISIDGSEPAIRGVLDKSLTLDDCPPELRPFMKELSDIGVAARAVGEDDSLLSVKALSEGKPMPVPRMDRVREILRGGVGWAYDQHHERDRPPSANGAHRSPRHTPTSSRSGGNYLDSHTTDPRRRTTSTENRAVAFANRINALALGMTKLKAFKERQDMVFKVLSGVGS
ncbi:hypothetical protein BDW22DRAFT_1364360 [Trametopsis cervina]|nr:hypothetical protein BDW22DRAFT_1364360 [Trametopsis cervina]